MLMQLMDTIDSEPAVTLTVLQLVPATNTNPSINLHCCQGQPTSQQRHHQVQVSDRIIGNCVHVYSSYTVAGLSPTEGVIMLLPIIAGGAGTYEMSLPVIMHVWSDFLLAPIRP